MFLIDSILNHINMYRLTLYGLAGLVLLTIALSTFGLLSHTPWHIAASSIYLVALSYFANRVGAALVKTKANDESAFITAFILVLIAGPVSLFQIENFFLLSFLAIAAMGSKYLLVWQGKHIFNPAAFAIVASAVLLQQGASWWVSSVYVAPAVIILGILLARKVGRGLLITVFLATYLVANFIFLAPSELQSFERITTFIWILATSSPILFFAFIMLPEPQTSPKRQLQKILYGIFVGLIAVLMPIYFLIPYALELALLFGNIFAYIATSTIRTTAQYQRLRKIAPNIFGFWFAPTRTFSFLPGQFLEWTLYHKDADSRGTRRYFTIASSPTESELLLTAKIPERPSSFKETLRNLKKTNAAIITGPEGDFILPKDVNRKLVFIAGGVGITPFRSMAKYLIDNKQSRDIILLYSASTKDEFAFTDLFDKAQEFGWTTTYLIGHMDKGILTGRVKDLQERLFYVSGPQPMVHAVEKMLRQQSVKARNIKRDYFPGYEEI